MAKKKTVKSETPNPKSPSANEPSSGGNVNSIIGQDGFLIRPSILSQGKYLQIVTRLRFTDDAIIRSNDNEEVLTFSFKALNNKNHFIIPWRKIKAKLRRIVLEQQRSFQIEPRCHLKTALCLRCPACFLFGGTGETSDKGPYGKQSFNILSRVLGESFISTTPRGVVAPYTANAVDELDLRTQTGETGALFTENHVPAETEFLGVITLRDPTKEMAGIIVDNLNRLTRLGARSVEWGRVVVTIEGCKLSDREDLTAVQLVKLDQKPNGGFDSLGLSSIKASDEDERSPVDDENHPRALVATKGQQAFRTLHAGVTELLRSEGLVRESTHLNQRQMMRLKPRARSRRVVLFKYAITLLDPLFYSMDGLGVAKPPSYLHATAINGAVLSATGLQPDKQPFVTRNDADLTGDTRNVPAYENSRLCTEFYLTPARPTDGSVELMPEIVKGDGDGSIQKVGTGKDGAYPQGEILRASKLFFIAPETEFQGYGFVADEIDLPEIIRLGSFRGKARLKTTKVSLFGAASNERVEHPVDPLVSEAKRGILINMFPYPLVEDAYCSHCFRVRLPGERFDRYIALPMELPSEPAAVITEGSIIV